MPVPAMDFEKEGGCLRDILEKAASSGLVSFDDLVKCLHSKGITYSDQIDDITAMFVDMGFEILY